MDGLIREVRMDKNGNLVARWVTPDGTRSIRQSKMPSPVLKSSRRSRDKSIQVIEKIMNNDSSLIKYEDDYTKFFKETNEETLDHIATALNSDDKSEYLNSQLSGIMNDNVESHVVDAWLATYDLHNDDAYRFDDMGEVEYLRGAIESRNSYKPEDFNPNDTKQVEAISNLYKFIFRSDPKMTYRQDVPGITSNGLQADSYRLHNSALAEFVVNNPERIDELVEASESQHARLNQLDEEGIGVFLDEYKNNSILVDGAL